MRFVSVGHDNLKRSGPHRKVEQWLDEVGIGYMSEQPFGNYGVDIYLSEWHLGIEVDGPMHSKAKDVVRDTYLLDNFGLRIVRVKPGNNNRKAVVMKAIITFIEVHADSAETRKQTWQLARL